VCRFKIVDEEGTVYLNRRPTRPLSGFFDCVQELKHLQYTIEMSSCEGVFDPLVLLESNISDE
jgi:hypothetical protein